MREKKNHHLFVWEARLVPVDGDGKPLTDPHEPRRFTLSYDAELDRPDPADIRVRTEAFRRAVRLEKLEDPTVADLDFDLADLRLVRSKLVTVT